MVTNKIDFKRQKEDKKMHFWETASFKNSLLILLLAFVFTILLASKHFFFRSLIDEDNVARKDIYAEKKIEVVDLYKTDQKRKERAQKLDPVMRPAEDSFITNDLNNLINEIYQIKDKKNVSIAEKKEQIMGLLDLSTEEREEFVANFFLANPINVLDKTVIKSQHTLNSILAVGITEKDINNNVSLQKLINQNTENETTRVQQKVISCLMEQVLVPNMVMDEEATDMARKSAADSVMPIKVVFEPGDKIVAQGERVTKVQKDALLKAGYSIVQINLRGVTGIFGLFVIGVFAVYYYLRLFEPKFLSRRHIYIITLLSLILTFISIIIPPDWSIYLLPIPAFVIMLSIFTNPRTAFFITVILTLMISSALWLAASRISVFIIVALFTAICTSRVNYTKRFQVIKIGIETSIVMLLCILSLYLLQLCLTDMATKWFLPDIIFGTINCLSSGIIALGMLPLLENVSGIITPYGITELGDTNQPLLKRLQFEAPGTFSHSMMLSTLSEAAAIAINANAALARVGALYHDVGKLKRPLFFIENQNYFGSDNPHCRLNPRLSKSVIISHVTDGMELADEYNLPDELKAFITQHHGTTLASYFYTQAIQQEGMDNVSQEKFRYPGPKPQTKETAIVMIADTVESASRTLKEYSQEELEKLINRLIVEKINDGQLVDCPLSLKDLKIIAETFMNTLRAAHHQRIKYHENILEELENRSKQQKIIPDDKILPDNLKSDTPTNNENNHEKSDN